MKQIIIRVTTLLSSTILLGLCAMTQTVIALEVGDKMPDFKLSASDGNTYTLSQFHGKQPVVIAFFPKTFTPG
jgi:thioredoxin-dependent peroxiredoxin